MSDLRRRSRRDTRLGEAIRSAGARRRKKPPLNLKDLEALAEQEGPGLLLRLGEALAIPGDLLRGALAGQLGDRVTARELLNKLGIEPEAEFSLTEPTIAGTAAGVGVLATDILTDPLSLLTGVGQLGKGAAALRGAQSSVRAGKAFRRAGREAVEDVRRIPEALRTQAEQLGTRTRLSAKEIEKAGGFRRRTDVGPRRRVSELDIGDPRRLQREEFGRAREQFAEAERLGTPARRLTEEIPFGPRVRPAGARRDVLTAREGFRTPVGAPGSRDLLQVGVPFTRFRTRVPLPRGLERAIGGGVSTAVAPIGLGLQKVFGRGGLVAKELQSAERFFARQADSVQKLEADKIAERAEELLVERAKREGLDPTADGVLDSIRDEFNTDIRGAREGSRAKMAFEEQEFADTLNSMVDARTFAQQRRGARDLALIEDYAERILTPVARQALRKRNLMDPYKEFINSQFDRHVARGASEGSQIGRNDYLPRLTEDANQWFRDNGILTEGENFFQLDAAATVSQTIRQRSLSVLQANLASSFVEDLAKIPGKAGDVTLAQFLKRMNLKGFRAAQWKKGAGEDTINRALAAAGVDTTTTLPFEAAIEFEKVFGKGMATIRPEALNRFLSKIYDPLASLFRVAVTAPFPAFHIRNFMSNTILNFMGGVRDPASYKKAFDTVITTNEALAKQFGKKFDRELANRLTEIGALQGGQLQRIVREAAERGGGADLPTNVIEQALLFARKNRVSRVGFGLGALVEDGSRLAHFFSKKARGFTDRQAVDSVNKFLFDYSLESLNGFERGVANRLFFFYRWNRFSIPLVLRTLFEHPNRAAVVIKGTTQPAIERPAGIPEFLRESAGIPVGVDPETGETSFVARFGSPFESLEFIETTGAKQPGILGRLTKLGREFVQQLVPPLRVIGEALAGEEFFLGREIQDLDKVPALQALFGELVGAPAIGEVVPRSPRAGGGVRFRGDPQVRFAAKNLPTSRVTSTISRLLEQPATAGLRALGAIPEGQPIRGQRGFGQELLRTLAGVTISEVDTGAETRRRAQRVVSRLLDQLRLSGEAGRLPVFVSTEKGKKSPRVKELLDLIRQINAANPSPRRGLPVGAR